MSATSWKTCLFGCILILLKVSTFCLHIFCDTLYIYYHICDIVQVWCHLEGGMVEEGSLQGPFSKWNDGWCSLFNNSSGCGSMLLMNPEFPFLVQLGYRRHYELCRDWQHRCLGICMVYIGWQAISQYKIQIKSSDIETEFLVKPGTVATHAFGTKIFIFLFLMWLCRQLFTFR